MSLLFIIFIIFIALVFDFTNGMHDACELYLHYCLHKGFIS